MILCPRCHGGSRVMHSDQNGAIMRRRRKCLSCGARWTTIEVLAPPPSKRTGGRVDQLRTPEALARAVARRRENQDANLAKRRQIPIEAVAEYRAIMASGLPAAEAAEIVRNSFRQNRTIE